MLLIAHRGNTSGPTADENNAYYVDYALKKGYDAEVDVWRMGNELFLGHDYPQYKISDAFLYDNSDHLWCHAKNLDALLYMLTFTKCNCFWHQEDDFTLTRSGHIWTYPSKPITDMSIIIVEGKQKFGLLNCYGVCSDYVKEIKNYFPGE